MRKDTTHDFIQMDIDSKKDIKPYHKFDTEYFKDVIRSVSAVFKDYPEIHVSYNGIEYQPETMFYVNSEGVEFIKTKFYTGFEIVAATQAEDGMNLADIYTAYALDPNDLPSKDSLIKAAKYIAENLTDTKNADFAEETYVGPVIFSDQAAGQIFAQVFAPNLVTQRQPLSDGGMQRNERFMAFQRKIGGRVLPEFLSMTADPKIDSYLDTPLLGTYTFDDEGVKAEKVELVKKGYLKALLSSRVPTRRVRESNGHNRGGAPMYSNLIVDVADEENQLSYNYLKVKMMELCKARELPLGNLKLPYVVLNNVVKSTF
jgi:predicted Zn-dependent protease